MAKVELKQPIVDEIKASLEGAQGLSLIHISEPTRH